MRLSLFLLALLCGAAHADQGPPRADPRLDGVKQIEKNVCVRGGNTAPGAPKNLKLVPQYCTCVAATYWDQVPKDEVEQLLDSGQSKRIDQHKDERMAQAKAACRR